MNKLTASPSGRGDSLIHDLTKPLEFLPQRDFCRMQWSLDIGPISKSPRIGGKGGEPGRLPPRQAQNGFSFICPRQRNMTDLTAFSLCQCRGDSGQSLHDLTPLAGRLEDRRRSRRHCDDARL